MWAKYAVSACLYKSCLYQRRDDLRNIHTETLLFQQMA